MTDLAQLREEIERVDRAIIELLTRRVELARAVGMAKRAQGLPTLDPAREAAVVRRAAELARTSGLSSDEVREIYWHIIGLSRRAQIESEANP